jgi:hypothetical protein
VLRRSAEHSGDGTNDNHILLLLPPLLLLLQMSRLRSNFDSLLQPMSRGKCWVTVTTGGGDGAIADHILLLLLLLRPLLLLLPQMSRLRSDFGSSAAANVTWQVLGNTVVMGPLNTPDVESAVQEQGFLAQTLLDVSMWRATLRNRVLPNTDQLS